MNIIIMINYNNNQIKTKWNKTRLEINKMKAATESNPNYIL